MTHYILINDKGEIAQRGSCPTMEEIPLVPGCAVQIIEANDPRRPRGRPDPDYRDMRRMDYPGMGDQLDAIWKVFDGLGIQLDGDAATLAARIKAVKLAHPKS